MKGFFCKLCKNIVDNNTLANKLYFPRTTCVECAKETDEWKKNFVEYYDDGIAKFDRGSPESWMYQSRLINAAQVNLYEFPSKHNYFYDGIYYDLRILESELKNYKL